MNIFVLDIDPVKSAIMQCDKHVVKMILESAQLLCSAHESAPYKKTHYNHPCAIWTRQSRSNYNWLVSHALALCDEYTFRYGKVHKSREVIEWCAQRNDHLSDFGLTPFVQAMPDEYKSSDAVKAYRTYYLGAKKYMLKYTKRMKPEWII